MFYGFEALVKQFRLMRKCCFSILCDMLKTDCLIKNDSNSMKVNSDYFRMEITVFQPHRIHVKLSNGTTCNSVPANPPSLTLTLVCDIIPLTDTIHCST